MPNELALPGTMSVIAPLEYRKNPEGNQQNTSKRKEKLT